MLLDAVESSQQTQGLVSTIVSVVTLLIGASTVLTALDSALEKIWKTEALLPGGVRGWVRTRLLSFGFILTLGFLLLVSLTISTGISNLRERIAEQHTALVGVIGALDFAASLVIVSALFALIYRYMPARRTPWRVVIIGGVLTAILFDIGRWGIGLYLAHSTQPSAYGAAASFAALLLWLYYTAQIFLYGAEFTACMAGVRDQAEKKEPPKGKGRVASALLQITHSSRKALALVLALRVLAFRVAELARIVALLDVISTDAIVLGYALATGLLLLLAIAAR